MSKAKSDNTSKSIENPISVIREAECPTSSGKSTLTYQVGTDESGEVFLKVSGNDGGGFWSTEWVSYSSVAQSISEWPTNQGITSMAFRKIFRGKSANTPGFLVAVLCAEGLLEPMGDKKRVHQACDPSAFLISVEKLRKGSTVKTKPRARAKSRATPKAKAKSTPHAKATAKATRKTPARSRKGK